MSRPPIELVVVGASAGGLDSIERLCRQLPKEFPIPIAIVQHLRRDRPSNMASLVAMSTPLEVREAEDKDRIVPGTIFVAPPNYHLSVEPDHLFSLSLEPEICFSRPSIDALFQSASDVYREALVGIVLTGANHDGAEGLATIKQRGGVTMVQSPDTASFPRMPEAAIEAAAVDVIAPPEELGAYLRKIAGF